MKKRLPMLVASVLALTLLTPSASYAFDLSNNTDNKIQQQSVDNRVSGKRYKVQEDILDLAKKYAPELVDSFKASFDKQGNFNRRVFPKLDEETKQKLNDIQQKIKDGTLTKEGAKAEIEKLGIKLPVSRRNFQPKLDEETKQKLNDIQQKIKEGTLTKEEAKAEIEKLGIKFPVSRRNFQPKLDEETKQKLNEIQQKIKEGTLTKEEAKAEIQTLGIRPYSHRQNDFRAKVPPKYKFRADLQQAVKNNDVVKIREILKHILESIQSHKQ